MNTHIEYLALCALLLSLTGSVYAQGTLTPPGAPAPTMRTLDQLEPRMPVGSVPFAITQPGSYVVVGNLGGGTEGISVQASNVTIDLNGFALTGDPLAALHGITVAPGSDNVTIRNGVVQQWGGDGVHAAGVTDLQLHNVRIVHCAGDGVEVGSATLRDVTVADNGGAGIRAGSGMGAGKVSVQDFSFVRAARNGGGGLSYVGPCDASVSDSHIVENTGHGLSWSSSAAGGTPGTPGATASSFVRLLLRRLHAVSNTASGVHIAEGGAVDVDCDFAACVFDRNGASGATIQVPHADARLDIMMRGGSACDNGGHGLDLAGGLSANQGFFDVALSRNGGSGCNKIDAGPSPGTMERVVAQQNALHGLDLAGGTWTLSRCTVSENTGGGVVYASKHVRTGHVTLMKFDDCAVERNGGDGLYVYTFEPDASYKVSMQDMHFRSNTGNGIRLSCDHALSSVELDAIDCSASANAACGVKLIAPVAMDKGLRFRIRGGDCDDNGQGGIFVDDSVALQTGVLIGCVLRNNGAAGFRAPGGALRLERCVASENSGDGFLVLRAPLSGSLYQSSFSFDGCDAVHNGGSGFVVAGFDDTTRASLSVTGGKAYRNVALGLDLSSSTGVRGRVHGVHLGDNGAHGLLSAAATLEVCDNQFTGNAGSGLHVLSGAHRVARNLCTDNAVGVFLTTTGSTVLQNSFGGGAGGGAGGAFQVPIEDLTGASDIAPMQNAASGTNPLGNLTF